jgi:hypothetical protein
VLVCFFAMACSAPSDDAGASIQTATEALSSGESSAAVGPRATIFNYTQVSYLPAGVAAGRDVVFIGDPLESRVIAYSRSTGQQIGELPEPPGGFVIPFIMHALGDDKVEVLGAGGLPQPVPFVPAHPFIYEYSYSVTPHAGFSATMTRFVDSEGTVVGFPEDFVHLDDGRLLLTDAVLGSIWVIERDGTYRPGIVPKTSDPADGIPSMMLCPTMPLVTVNGVPFLFSGSTIPGVTAITVRRGTVYFSSACGRGVYAFPLAILDDHRQPYKRAADIRLVSPTPANVQVEELLEMQFNPFDKDDPFMYAARGMQLEIMRIDSRNGRREVVAHDAHLLDFPSSLAFLPPVAGCESERTAMAVVSNQQERTPITNDAVTEDSFNLPFLVTKVVVKN